MSKKSFTAELSKLYDIENPNHYQHTISCYEYALKLWDKIVHDMNKNFISSWIFESNNGLINDMIFNEIYGSNNVQTLQNAGILHPMCVLIVHALDVHVYDLIFDLKLDKALINLNLLNQILAIIRRCTSQLPKPMIKELIISYYFACDITFRGGKFDDVNVKKYPKPKLVYNATRNVEK